MQSNMITHELRAFLKSKAKSQIVSNKAFERSTSFLKVLLLTIYLNCNAKAAAESMKKMVYPGDYFWNMPPRQGSTRGVRHLFYALKARGSGREA